MIPPLKRGDFVTISWDGGFVDAMVVLAMSEGKAITLMFRGVMLAAWEGEDGGWMTEHGPLMLVRGRESR